MVSFIVPHIHTQKILKRYSHRDRNSAVNVAMNLPYRELLYKFANIFLSQNPILIINSYLPTPDDHNPIYVFRHFTFSKDIIKK